MGFQEGTFHGMEASQQQLHRAWLAPSSMICSSWRHGLLFRCVLLLTVPAAAAAAALPWAAPAAGASSPKHMGYSSCFRLLVLLLRAPCCHR